MERRGGKVRSISRSLSLSNGRSLSLSKGRLHPVIPGSPCPHSGLDLPHSGLDPESPEPPVAKTASCASHRNICPIAEVGYVASGSAQCRFCNLDFGRIGVLIFASTSRQPLEGSRLRPRRRGEIPCQPRRQLGGRLARSRFKKKKAGHLDYIRCSEEVNQIMDRITKSTNSSDMVQGI